MSNNIKASIINPETPVDPNYKGLANTYARVYPLNSAITSVNGVANQLNGQLDLQYTVPKGFKEDTARS